MVLGCTCAAVVHWEFAEWAFDELRGCCGMRSYRDTLFDMGFGVFGGAVFVAMSARRGGGRETTAGTIT